MRSASGSPPHSSATVSVARESYGPSSGVPAASRSSSSAPAASSAPTGS